MDSLLILTPLILLAMGVVGLVLPRALTRFFPLVGAVTIALLFGMNPTAQSTVNYNWLGDISLILTSSPLRLIFFAMLWFSLLIYGIATLNREKGDEAFTLITAGGMGTALFAGDLLTLFIGWEVMTWGTYLPLLDRENDTKAPRRYLVFSLAGAAAILTGILLMAKLSGSFELSTITGRPSAFIGAPFLMIGFLLKAGTMPFHRWIPSTYSEASDLFTGFMSGALSKAGIFGILLVVSLLPVFPKMVGSFVGWLGIATSLFATFRAIRSDDIKALLTWSSISQVGYIVTALAVNNSSGTAGAIYHAINHTVIKVLLFTVVAGIIARTGKSKFSQMGALIYKMPFSFIAVLMGIIALAGMPPLSGFASKWLIYTSLLEEGKVLQLVVVIAASTTAFLYNFKLIYGIFLGQPTEVELASAKEIGWGYRLALVPSLLLLMAMGTFPSLLMNVINPVLAEMGMTPFTVESNSILVTNLGSFNGTTVMTTFGVSFAIILALFSLVKSKSRNLHQLDIAYAGETPTEETPLHYGWGVGRELHRIPFVGFWLAKSTQNIYNYIHRLMDQGASLVRLIYNGNIGVLIGLSFVVALILWTVLGGNA